MKTLIFLMVSLCIAACQAAPQNIQQLTAEQQLGVLNSVIDRNVDAKIELILQLLQIWRNNRQQGGGNNGQFAIAPLPYEPVRGAGNSAIKQIPHHGHSHGHDDDSHEDDSHEHSHEDDGVDLTGSDPEHKPGEVFDFEKGVLQVDKKPIVPIGGHDH